MKTVKSLLKLTAAIAAVVAIAYVVVKYMDAITTWLKGLCPACKCNPEPIIEEVPVEDAAEVEVSAEEPAEDEQPPVEEVVPEEAAEPEVIPEGEPVAEDSDFEA